MDLTDAVKRFPGWLRKYRPAMIVLLAGVLLMLIPKETETEKTRQAPITETPPAVRLEQSLENILSQLEGAGEVRVLLTEARGMETRYQCDEEKRNLEVQKKTVLISGKEREELGLVRQINPPTYLGAVVLCQGADQAAVRLAVVKAVASVTGLTTDKVTVLKMK